MRFMAAKLAKTVHAAAGCVPDPSWKSSLQRSSYPVAGLKDGYALYFFEGNRSKEGKEKWSVKEGRVAQKFISTYFQMRTPVHAVPLLCLQLFNRGFHHLGNISFAS